MFKSLAIVALLLPLFGLEKCLARTNEVTAQVGALQEELGHLEDRLSRQINELLWVQQLSDVAVVDKVRFTGPPPRAADGSIQPAGSNEVVVSAFTFVPKEHLGKGPLKGAHRKPLLVLAHGEIHGNVASDEEAHIVRELMQQGYEVIAPDYRGSSGYGGEFWRRIDYGGLEIEDVHAARQWMLENHPEVDPGRVGIIGWSHGGAIALLTIFAHPDDYQACYAGVPVSDLEERIRLKGKSYEQLFAAPYHLGKTVAESPEEYRRRSPAWNVDKLRVPLLVHANTNDEDVTMPEVQRLLAALQAAEKQFQYHVYTNAPGGHYFNRLDTELARQSRTEVWKFLAEYLKPEKPK